MIGLSNERKQENGKEHKSFLWTSRILSGLSDNSLKKFFILTLLLTVGCNRDLTDDPIPFVPFAPYTITLYLPEFQSLAFDGGYKTIGSIGVRGVLLYRNTSTSYLAFEKNCSYHPNDAGATIDVHASKLFMTCSGCGSTFNFMDGMPSGGVAWRPLRRYRVELTTPTLMITNEIIN